VLTAEQKEARRKGIGGSDVASVLNLEPYGCQRMLYYDKTGVEPDFDFVNPQMERGIYLEDIAVEVYRKQTGNEVVRVDAVQSETHPYMLSNIDREIWEPTDKDGVYDNANAGILEVKCPNRDNFLRQKRLGLPYHQIVQGQHYLYVNKKQWMEYAIFCADLWKLEAVPVKRDEELISMIVGAEHVFWDMVIHRQIPDRLEFTDKRCKRCDFRLGCWGEMWEEKPLEFEDNSDYEEYDDGEFLKAASLHKEHVALQKQAKENVDVSKKQLIEMLGDREKVKCPSGKFSNKWETKKLTDMKKMKRDKPEVVAEYEYESGSKPFRFYPSKEE
jgi:putative phage-type endonuclease